MSSAERQITRADELNGIGAQLFGQNQLEPARLHFLAALALEPDHPQALQNMGATLRNLNHYAASEVMAKRSVAATGGNAFCRSNLGVAQLSMRRFGESIATLRDVLRDLPESAPSWHNYGLALYMIGNYNEALAAFDKSLLLATNDLNVFSDRALTYLSLGQIQKGLAEYEVRWRQLKNNKLWSLGIPEWRGEDLSGRRILVHHEQGFGDSIMLVRFIKDLAKLGPHITLVVPEELRRLFQHNFPFVSVMNFDNESLNKEVSYDYHSPLLSVMRWLKVEKPSDISDSPYLYAAFSSTLRLPQAKYKVGLCWASGNHGRFTPVDRRRLVPLTDFLPLLERSGIALISLQKGEDAKDIAANGLEGLVFDISPKLEDFAATANVIAGLDLVISVDSAVAHLAGALGKPCIMLSPYTRCWRWWGRDSGETGWPWYKSMEVYSQKQQGSWDRATDNALRAAFRGERVKAGQ